ncbi:winged helix-turn-helix domain-containing protein [Actinoplanes sp. N902-109]|uniref:winged helix-turn-helix domain-containing protein n=1 Tax=Actinoplanes sp. (strain N902-109) TaxID=649831 RepID=UPI0003294210|nr:winged helix-turn-helix domain-containing protein [Actinoplanes sp. N902-109]AGL19515.1 hypothetical protein L083_6005 [Actinoplanes sp. N902-109]
MPASTTGTPDQGATVGQWNALIRRARLDDRQKLAALVMSSYADADGTNIHCGVVRLSVDLQCSYSTAQRYLRWLRAVGLVELVRAGNRRRKWSDEYRLILGPDVLEHLDVLDPGRYDELCNATREDRRRTSGGNQASTKVTSDSQASGVTQDDASSASSGVTQDDAHSIEPVTDMASPQMTPDEADQASNDDPSGVTQDDAPPSLTTSPERSTSPTTVDGDLRTAVTVTREDGSEMKTICPAKCGPHKLAGGTRPDGRPACPLCRVAQDQAAGKKRPRPALPTSHIAPVIHLRPEAS